VRAFEPLARETFGTRFAIDANSGSDARHAALVAAGCLSDLPSAGCRTASAVNAPLRFGHNDVLWYRVTAAQAASSNSS
jgi:hypothetical protein